VICLKRHRVTSNRNATDDVWKDFIKNQQSLVLLKRAEPSRFLEENLKSKHTIRRLDTKPIPEDLSEVYCVMCIKDEILRLPWVLEYHRRLGVGRFFIIDNASSDGCAEYLLEQPDVHVFHTSDSYGESSFGISWQNLVLDDFCT